MFVSNEVFRPFFRITPLEETGIYYTLVSIDTIVLAQSFACKARGGNKQRKNRTLPNLPVFSRRTDTKV